MIFTVTRHFFETELEKLHEELIKMASLVEKSIENTIFALKNQDIDLAKQIFENDDVIDELERSIEKMCLQLIARQQPLAKDLRAISTALKIITDMERIADHSADIAEITIRMKEQTYFKPLDHIEKMAIAARNMVKDAIKSFVEQNIELAKKVCDSDDEIDSLFDTIKFELTDSLKKDSFASENVDQIVNFLFIAKYLERMGDHATNIGEWVIFNVTGNHDHIPKQVFKNND